MNKKNKKLLYNISYNKSVNFLRHKQFYLERDIYNIISIVFNVETAIRLGNDIKSIEIEITKESYAVWDISVIEKTLEDILKLVLYKRIEVKLIEKDINRLRRTKDIKFDKVENICLFSGGVDSTTGILYLKEKYQNKIKGVFVCHGDQAKISYIVNSIQDISNKNNIGFEFNTMHAPKMFSKGYSQLRGLLYVLYSSIYVNLRKSKRIFITECGPTMYQIRYSPYDSITMTTHPYVMKYADKLIQLFYNKKIDLVLPFEDLTKSEVAILNPLPEIFKISHSCVGSRWIKSGVKKDSCGLCYGCVIRRLGLITAGLPDTDYEKDPVTEDIDSIHIMNALSFSTEMLLDYDSIDEYTKDIIEEFNKKDLFYRFALDNLSAIHILVKEKKKVNKNILFFYEQVKKELGTKVFDNRIKLVRSKKKKPNLKNIVK